jgi:hypothetical protein
MKNPRFANPQKIGILLDYDASGQPSLYVDSGPLYDAAKAGAYGPIADYAPPEPDVDTTPISDLAAKKLVRVNDAKNATLDGGFIHDGKLFDSDSKARLAYLELSLKLSQDATYSTPWKASTGVWVTMDAALFAALQPAYEAHIQACFGWQAAREMEVAAALAIEDEAEARAALGAVSEVM